MTTFTATQWPRVRARLWQYALLTRMHRPIGTLLLLWPMLWALWIAGNGHPDAGVLIVFLLGTWLMRSAGCAINDFADREVDPHVARTTDRPLATGRIRAREAVGVFVVLSLLAFALVLTQNRLTILLSFVGVALAASYPFMKRFHHLPQVHLGAAFGWAVPMAWTAQTGQMPTQLAWLIFIAAVVWATIYDTQYAMVDRDDDIRIGVKSTAILFGDADRLIIGVLQVLMLLALLLIGRDAGFGWPYFLALVVAAGMFGYQQLLTFYRVPEFCFRAFMNNNWFGAVIFAGIVASYLLHG
ncbi:4-hydroxybenzoate octaprenyltransferase [Acidihalobacter ferrooxydans]|uniref:4-hydroxybenzoate octaprenyltransferase n=1 Tax=Acidihalobacter ferrooxydans TaxID=1765967 RepID=A0A1P8UKI1_9GAMM|nr:4-hydroxybenzoate octaprenyltransferase [Acidihalobacter ferrooxydans]APZ44356.1 4-hydroxybenzoate polyprenyltransferase [Acidihalobacter ferrooxydans]